MHGYSTDSGEKKIVSLLLASGVIALAWVSSRILAGHAHLRAVVADDPEGISLIYQYQNQPLADAMKTLHMHYGTAMLRFSNGNCLVGDYYAGRDRRTFGRIYCRRQLRSPQTYAESAYTARGAKGFARTFLIGP